MHYLWKYSMSFQWFFFQLCAHLNTICHYFSKTRIRLIFKTLWTPPLVSLHQKLFHQKLKYIYFYLKYVLILLKIFCLLIFLLRAQLWLLRIYSMFFTTLFSHQNYNLKALLNFLNFLVFHKSICQVANDIKCFWIFKIGW